MFEGFTLLVFLALSGFWFASRLNEEKFKFASMQNYALLYTSTIIGAFIFILSFVVVTIFKYIFTACELSGMFALKPCSFEQDYPFPFFDTVLLSVAIAEFAPFVANYWYTNRMAREAAMKDAGLIPEILIDAQISDTSIEITTKSRKIYIGWVIEGPGITKKGEIADVAIVPVESGYRDEATLKRTTTTNYAKVIDGLLEDGVAPDEIERVMRIAIPISEIVSIRPFSVEIRQKFDD